MDFSLKAFYTVAKLGSFTRAADILFLTQPAVTFQIKKLEDEYNTRLFTRLHNQIHLTESGRILFSHAERILEQYEQAKEDIARTMSELKGEVRIGVASLLGTYHLPRVLGALKQNYPQVDIVMHMGDSGSLAQSIKEQVFDFVIVSEPISLKQFVVAPYFTDELVLVVNETHPWRDRKCLSIEEVAAAPGVLREKGSGTREMFRRWLRSNGVALSEINTVLTLGSAEAVKSAVESGVGYGIISEIAVKNEIESRTLFKVCVRDMKLARRFLIVYPRKRYKSKLVETFIRFLCGHVPG